VRLLQNSVAAGDDLSRAPLRDAASPSQQQSQERVRIGPQLNGCGGRPRTGRNLQSNWNAQEGAYAKLAESEAIRSNVRESLNKAKRFSSLPSWKQQFVSCRKRGAALRLHLEADGECV
jgi:hypothetical protein